MKRKLIAIIAAAAMLAVTACGNTDTAKDQAATAPVEESAEPIEKSEESVSTSEEMESARKTSSEKTDKSDGTARETSVSSQTRGETSAEKESESRTGDKADKKASGGSESASASKGTEKVPEATKTPKASEASSPSIPAEPSATVPATPAPTATPEAPAKTPEAAPDPTPVPEPETPAVAEPAPTPEPAPEVPASTPVPEAPAATPAPEAHVHSYDGGTVTTPATCGTDGIMTYTCSCGDTRTEAIPATGQHSPEDQWLPPIDRQADCTHMDHHHVMCSVCGAYISEGSYPALGHDVAYREKEIIMDGPCTGMRVYEPYCTRCGTTTALGPTKDEFVEFPHEWVTGPTNFPVDYDSEGNPIYGTIEYCSKCNMAKPQN